MWLNWKPPVPLGMQGDTGTVENNMNVPNKKFFKKWNCYMIIAFEHLFKRIKIRILNKYLYCKVYYIFTRPRARNNPHAHKQIIKFFKVIHTKKREHY